MSDCMEFGTTELTQAPLFVRKIAMPTNFDYQPFSTINQVNLGQGIIHGFASATYTWVNLDSQSLYRIKKLVDNATNNDGKLFIRIPVVDGSFIGETYQNFIGTVLPLNIEEGGSMFGQGVYYASLTLEVNNLVGN